MRIDSRLIGFTAHRESLPLSKLARAICSIRRSPDPIKDRAHPSSRNSSSECLRPQELADHLAMPASPVFGFRSLFATSLVRSYVFSRSIPGSTSFRPQAFTASRRFLPRSSSQAYFIPLPRPGSSFVQGSSLPPQPPFFIRRSLPPCRCCFAARTHGPTFAGSLVRPRATLLGFEAFICARPRSLGSVIHLAQGRSPLRIPCSSRISLSRRRPPLSQLPSAHDVARSMFNDRFSSCDDRHSRSSAGYRLLRFARAIRRSAPVQYSCESVLISSDLSTRFHHRSSRLLAKLGCRGSCIFRRMALEPRCFREPLPSLRMLESSRIRPTFPPCGGCEVRSRESCTPFGGPRRSHLAMLPTCSTHELANSCSHFRMLTFAQRVWLFPEKLAPLVRTRSRTCPVHTLRRFRTHPLRAFNFSVLSSRKFGRLVSVAEDLKPPCSSL